MMEELRADYSDLPEVTKYLDTVERDIRENTEDFLTSGTAARSAAAAGLARGSGRGRAVPPLSGECHGRQQRSKGAPVIYEDNPTHQTLVGRVEHMARFGALVTDFNLLTPGALHRANGGYLFLDAQRLLAGKVRLGFTEARSQCRRDPHRDIGAVAEPREHRLAAARADPARCQNRAARPAALYYLLSANNEEFKELFKIAADFDDRIERTPETTLLYARLVCAVAPARRTLPLDRGAVARVIEQRGPACRVMPRVCRPVCAALSICCRRPIKSPRIPVKTSSARQRCTPRSAAKFAAATASIAVCRTKSPAKPCALRSTESRSDKSTASPWSPSASLLSAHPAASPPKCASAAARSSTSSARSQLGGPLHSKGVLILVGFLGGRFGRSRPLSLNASLVFEQSYGGVDGDSASAAELFAPALGSRRGAGQAVLAVTGSVDQRGQIQAIGGVNEKIEGFFDACRAIGFSGNQGVSSLPPTSST